MTSLETALPYIGGRYVKPHGENTVPVVDPTTGTAWATIPDCSPDDVDRAVESAHHGQRTWSRLPGTQRASLLHRLADVIESKASELAAVEVRDNGKLYREMYAQLQAAPNWFRYFAGLADKLCGETVPMDKPSLFNYTVRETVGVVGCIVPWNSPLLLGAFTFAPALSAGNSVVVKPSEHASMSTIALGRCFELAGFPDGVFNAITGYGNTAGSALASHPGIDAMTFTGGAAAGAQVARSAIGNFSPVILELGGKSPNIIFDDAPLEAAVNGVLAGIFAASGQTCIAGSRVYVQRGIYDEVVARIVERAERIVVGDPMESGTEMGPLANEAHFRRVLAYFDIAAEQGGTVATGAATANLGADLASGYFVRPTVCVDVPPASRIAREEIFGPVAALMPFDSEDEVVSLANDTEYGLAAGVWTTDLARGHRMAAALQAGTVWVNTYRTLSPNMPFGGFKNSGVGAENGLAAMQDFTRTKSVWMELEPEVRDPFGIQL